MTASPWSRGMMVIMALVAVSTTPSVRMAQASPPSEVTTASGGTHTQSGNCPNGQQQDEHCLPGGPGSPPARPGGPIHPSITPPVVPPIVPPPGIPSAVQPVDPEATGYTDVVGWAKATLHVKDDSQDVRYESSIVNLRFKPRDSEHQEMEGNTQYDLMRTVVTWTAAGTVHDCTISGQILVTIPSFLNQPIDPTRPAFGYLNVVGLNGGDYHSIVVSATNSETSFTKTCPGDPPTVTKHFFPGTYLLNIPWQANSYDGGKIVYEGTKQYDLGFPGNYGLFRPYAPQPHLRAIRGSRLYTWEWELYPEASPEP
jgi:hypothetical protein